MGLRVLTIIICSKCLTNFAKMRVGFAARVLSTKVADAFDEYSKVEKFKTNPLALQRYLRFTGKGI